MIVISSTFVAEPLEGPLAFMLAELGMEDAIHFAPFNQVFQELLTPGSHFDRNRGGINLALIRLDDFVRDRDHSDRGDQAIYQIAAELADALKAFANNLTGHLILSMLPCSLETPDALASEIRCTTADFAARFSGCHNIQVLTSAEIGCLAGEERDDARRDALARIPFTDAYFCALAIALARRIHALRVPAAKVLALDCDNTLWRGIVGEDGVAGIAITKPFMELQDFAIAQQRQGILLCLVSKNLEADVMEVLDHRCDMRLHALDFVANRINWLPKPTNLRSLAEELNLGLDAFVFMDDNPLECAQMRNELPEVVTLQVPAESQISDWLPHIWIFDKLGITAEDAKRTQLYREDAARRSLESRVSDIGQFLSALELEIDISEPQDDDWDRIAQLTQRTNQFNFTTIRRTVQDLNSLLKEGAEVRRVQVSDRFGDYGLVGVLISQASSQTFAVDTFLLSCRVLGRGVEHAMLRSLGQRAIELGLPAIELRLINTGRNAPARAFADSIAAGNCEPSLDGFVYRLPVELAIAVQHRPGCDPTGVVDATRAAERKSSGQANAVPEATRRSTRYSRLAEVLVSGEALLQQVNQQRRRPRRLDHLPTPAVSALEMQLKNIWEELLGIDEVGVDDDYFALGGGSLQSVELFTEIDRRFGVKLSLTTILGAPTVRTLAAVVHQATGSEPSQLVPLRSAGPESLFLVHDGLGETLLYLHLARRIPAKFSVYAIEPRRVLGIPLAYSSIEEMAEAYVKQIRFIQPTGPYRVGGMCAGGLIAYAMAARLQTIGERVDLVVVLDGAAPQAQRRSGWIAERRLGRLRGLMQKNSAEGFSVRTTLALAGSIFQRGWNLLRYESSAYYARISARLRFRLLQILLRRGWSWPAWLPGLTVAEIYSALEARYKPPCLSSVPVLVVCASRGEDQDTPYREIFTDDALGWGRFTSELAVAHVDGGHASMLQEPFVGSLSTVLARHLAIRPNLSSDPGHG